MSNNINNVYDNMYGSGTPTSRSTSPMDYEMQGHFYPSPPNIIGDGANKGPYPCQGPSKPPLQNPVQANPNQLRRSPRLQSQAFAASQAFATPPAKSNKRSADEAEIAQDADGNAPKKTKPGQSYANMAKAGSAGKPQNVDISSNSSSSSKTPAGGVPDFAAFLKHGALKKVDSGDIVWGPLITTYRGSTAPSANDSGHLYKDTTVPAPGRRAWDEAIYVKQRFHIVLRTQKHHMITVPLYTFKNSGLAGKDPSEFMQVVRRDRPTDDSDQAIPNPTAHRPLHIKEIHAIFKDWFLETPASVSYAQFLAPFSLEYDWRMNVIGKLEAESRNFLLFKFRSAFCDSSGQNTLPGEVAAFLATPDDRSTNTGS